MAITEKQLIIPALKKIAENDKGLTTSELIDLLRDELKPNGTDVKKLKNRGDDRFSQKVRNLISHKTINDYICYAGKRMVINDKGLDYLADNNDEYSSNIENNDDFRDENSGYELASRIPEPDNVYLSVSDLKRKYDRSKGDNPENSLILSPAYQRYDGIWSTKNKSLFIESLILNIPIPSIYLSEDGKGNFIVIDGRQRLSTIFDFMEDKFRLSGLSILKELNGFNFSMLVDGKRNYKSKIEDRSLHIAKLRYGTDETFIIETFERVNTKGIKLNAQEIRNAIHQGQSTKLLNSISNFYSGKNQIIDKKRMKDKYIILRYFAMQHFYDCLSNKNEIIFKSISDYLSRTMIRINALSDDEIEKKKSNFIDIYDRAKEIFGNKAFRLGIGHPINMILFEITLIIINESKNKENSEIKDIFNRYLHWNDKANNDNETRFEKNIKYHRDSKENIQERLLFIKELLV